MIRHGLFAASDHAHTVRLDSEIYGQRWTAEPAFTASKQRFGAAVRPSAWYDEFRQLILTAAVYRLERAFKQ